MRTDCIWTPEVNGVPSKLFTDLSNILGNRSRAIELYSLFSQKKVQEVLNIKNLDSLGEPTVEEVLSKIGDPKKLLDKDSLIKYIIEKENLNEGETSFNSAYDKLNRLRNSYDSLTFNISHLNNKFKVNVSYKTTGKVSERDTIFRGELQNKLLEYLRVLGFDVIRNSTVDNTSRFSPLNAEDNAETLKKVIRLAKGELGEKDFPEEFSHLIIEGLHNHPLVIRLLNTINNDVVKNILGDSYDTYKEKYSGNSYLLQKEAAGKILADALSSGKVTSLQERVINTSLNKLSKGDVSKVDSLIDEAREYANEITNILDSSDIIDFFDKKYILNADTLYSLHEEVSGLEKISDRAYEVLNKKLKITSARSRRKRSSFGEEEEVIKKMHKLMQQKQYASSSFAFLNYVLNDMQTLYDKIAEFNDEVHKDSDISLTKLRNAFRLLKRISTSLTAYKDIIESMAAISTIEGIEEELSQEDIDSISDKASEVKLLCSNITSMYERARFTSIFKFFEYYWGDSEIISSMSKTGKISLEDIMNMAPSDISGISRLFNSMEDSSDPLLTIVDSIFKSVHGVRDSIILRYTQEIKAIHEEYVKRTGSRDTSFVFSYDENGVPTGMLKSDIDFKKYYKDRREFIYTLKNEGLDQLEIASELAVWERNHTEAVTTSEGRKEILPKKELYPSNELSELNEAQLDYYNKMMAIKKRLDNILPSKYINTYKAVQKKVSSGDIIIDKIKNPKKTIKQIKAAIEKNWFTSEDDTGYGETVLESTEEDNKVINEFGEVLDGPRQKQILLDFAGNPVAKVPIYYTARLKDMNYLSTDFTDSLIAYAGMAVNYDQVEKIADAMEVIKEFVGDRRVRQNAGSKVLYERYKNHNGEEFEKVYTKEGKSSTIYKAFENYLDINLYDRKKKKEVVYIGDKEINYGKIGDNFKLYSTLVGMGYNIFSVVSNATMGNAQLLIEAIGNSADSTSAFTLKNLVKGISFYMKHLPSNFINQYNDIKKDKLSLLMLKFDATEDFFNSTKDMNTASGWFKRTLSLISPLSGMSAGEHYLHGVLLCACLDKVKVRTNNQEKSLLDAFEVVENKTPDGSIFYDVVLPEDATFINGDNITERDLHSIKIKYQKTSHNINGAYNDIDKGQANLSVLGRLALQYRQWMPSFIMNRFKTRRYNDAVKKDEEGFYITTLKFIVNYFSGLKEGKFNIFTRFKMLSSYQKGNIYKALTEMSMFWILSFILNNWGEPDDQDSYAVNFIKLTGHRLALELGSFTPSLEAIDNIQTLIQSPIPSMEKTDYLINLINLVDLTKTVESGKFEGWNKWLRNAYYATPYVRNIARAIELGQGNFDMFKAYLDD